MTNDPPSTSRPPLAGVRVLDLTRLLEHFPMTGSGKVLKRKLLEMHPPDLTKNVGS